MYNRWTDIIYHILTWFFVGILLNEHDNVLHNIIIILKKGSILIGRINNKYFYSKSNIFITFIYYSDVFNTMLKINILL